MMNQKTYTCKEAAELVGVSGSRIRQLALAGEIEHSYFGNALAITEKGIDQAKNRKTSPGPKTKKNSKTA